MGANYSAGPLPRTLANSFQEMTLLKVRSFMLRFERMRRGKVDVVRRDEMFLSRDEVKWLFKLKIMQVYEMFRRLDPDSLGRISIIDLWGSLALISLDSPDDKVEFIFGLVDYNRSGYLTRANLQNLMLCATRGLSHFKGTRELELKIINKTLSVIAGMALVNESGAISLRDVRVCMLTDENCKAYFAALGSQVTASVDSGKLVAQRRDILLEIATVEAQIDEVVLRLNVAKETQDEYEKERGGDISALQIHELDSKPQRNSASSSLDLEEATSTSLDAFIGQPSDEQRLRRLHRAKAMNAARGKSLINDAVVFTDSKARNPKLTDDNSGGDFDVSAVRRKWSTLQCADDGMCKLDIDIVEDLFEAAGIILTDAESESCLQDIPPNQLGLRSVDDIIHWYRRKMCTDVPIQVLPLWRKVANEAFEAFQSSQRAIFQTAADLCIQRKLVDAIERKEKIMRSNRLGQSKEAEEDNSLLSLSVGEIQGSQRLVAWQRQQVQGPASLYNWEFTFGHPEDVSMPPLPEALQQEEAQPSAGKKSKLSLAAAKSAEKQKEAAKAAFEAEWERTKWKMNLAFDLSVAPPPTTITDRPCFFDSDTLVVKDDLMALDLLDFFKKHIPASQSNPVEVNTPFGSTAWFFLNIAPSASAEDEMLLIKLILNFFESVPLDYRANLYTKVEAKSLRMQAPGVEGDAGISRVVAVLLLHEEDWYRRVEEMLPPGLLLSRAFRKINFSFRAMDILDDLYKASFSFENFDERLFGPQEDELGEEGMNPIRFAKLQRQRQSAIQESIDRAFRMSDQELQMLLKDRGLNVFGDHTDLATRARAAFKRQSEISGFGELSAWGADMSRRIYQKFNPPIDREKETDAKKEAATKKKATKKQSQTEDPRGMSLWELNSLLLATGSETVYDKKDYKKIMDEQQFNVDKEGRLLDNGIVAYYELYGNLANDIRTFGIGSLSEKLKGEARLFAALEPEAFASLIKLLEEHSILQKPLKLLTGLLSSISEFAVEHEFDSVSDIFNIGGLNELEGIRTFCNSPGWISSAIHKVAEWLANGEEGTLRSLRNSVLNTFGKYHQWDEVFEDFFRSVKPPTQTLDDEPFDLKAFFLDKLGDILPPSIPQEAKTTLAKAIELRELNVKLGELIINSEGRFRLSREQREDLMQLRARNEAVAIDTIRKVEEEKQYCAAHALALYDGIRRCVLGFHSIGFGTKDLTARVLLTGFDWVRYLPRGIGEKSIPRQLSEEKLRRAAQRKEAAFAALERERIRKDKNNPDRVADAQKKAEKKLQKKKEEEVKAFEEALKQLTLAREERKSAAEIATMVRLWEKLQQVKTTRYPKSLSAAVSLNNFACVLSEFYGPDHFRGKDALKCQDAALTIVVDNIMQLETVLVPSEPDEIPCRLPLMNDSAIHVRREGNLQLSEEETLEFIQSSTRVFTFPEDLIVPFLTILQNSLTILNVSSADPRNVAQLDILGHVKKLVKHLYDALPMKERERFKKRQGKSLEGTPVLIMGDVETQMSITAAEVRLAEADTEIKVSGVSAQDFNNSGVDVSTKKVNGGFGSKSKKMANIASGGLISKEELESEVARKQAERQEKKLKMMDQRKAANMKRAQTIRRRNRLYQLITTGEINRIFDMKAGHVLADNAKIQWGTDVGSIGDPLDFLDSDVGSSTVITTGTDDQTLNTLKTGGVSLDTVDAGRTKSTTQKKDKSRSKVQFDDESIASKGGESYVSAGDFSVTSAPTVETSTVLPKQSRGKFGLLSWLFRNRERLEN